MKILQFVLLVFFELELNAQKFKNIEVKSWEYGDTKLEQIKIKYILDVPEGYEFKRNDVNDSKGFLLTYSDSSVVYLNDNETTNVTPNSVNLKWRTSRNAIDTMNYQGVQANGNYWREYKVGQVIIGYLNVPSKRREIFDKTLMTLRRKRIK